MRIYSTQNQPLAWALATAGCKWASPEEHGPTMNTYTPGFLRGRKLLGTNPVQIPQFEAAAKDAIDRNIPGIVSYFFEGDELLDRVISGWDQASAFAREMATWSGMSESDKMLYPDRRPKELPEISPEVIAMVLNIYANNEANLKALAFANPAVFSTLGGTFEASGKQTTTGVPGGTTRGAGKVWSINASPETRERLGI